MSAMFELCRLHCEYAELHAPSSFRLDELQLLSSVFYCYDLKPLVWNKIEPLLYVC